MPARLSNARLMAPTLQVFPANGTILRTLVLTRGLQLWSSILPAEGGILFVARHWLPAEILECIASFDEGPTVFFVKSRRGWRLREGGARLHVTTLALPSVSPAHEADIHAAFFFGPHPQEDRREFMVEMNNVAARAHVSLTRVVRGQTCVLVPT